MTTAYAFDVFISPRDPERVAKEQELLPLIASYGGILSDRGEDDYHIQLTFDFQDRDVARKAADAVSALAVR